MKLKRMILALFCLGLCLGAAQGEDRTLQPDKITDENAPLLLPPVVDLRVELVEIVARLAEIPSHSTENWSLKRNPYYVAAIESHFAPYKNHPAVEYMRSLSQKYGISYDAVPAIAPCLTDLPELKPRIDFHTQTPEGRWKANDAYEFADRLRDFYTKANCRTFFDSQQERYKNGIKGIQSIYDDLDTKWFNSFFGVSNLNSTFHPILAFGQGEFNYGGPAITLPDGKKEIYAMMGSVQYDSLGNSSTDRVGHLSLIVHEFGHSFVNPIQEANQDVLKKGGEAIFSHVGEIMARQAYPAWSYVLNESLVRASEIRFFMARQVDSVFLEKKIKYEVQRGFVWMPELVKLLDDYENNRETYPTMESFIPQMAKFYEEISKEIPARLSPQDNKTEN